jgi:hypothetical protein
MVRRFEHHLTLSLTLLAAPMFALIVWRTSAADSLELWGQASPSDVSIGPFSAVRDTSDPVVPVTPIKHGSTLRPGKRLHRLFEITLANDPTDDETSDDPADDDDAWDDLTAFQDTEAPVTAWSREIVRAPSDPEAESVPAWSELPLFTSFLTLQRLRC